MKTAGTRRKTSKGRPAGRPRRLVLIAAECSFVADCVDMSSVLGLTVAAGIVFAAPECLLAGIPEILRADEIDRDLSEFSGLICEIWPEKRQAAHAKARGFGMDDFPTLVHPSAIVSPSLACGKSVFINAGAVIAGAVEIEDFVLVNRAAAIGHHAAIEEFASIGPGATLASNCRIGRAAMIGAGAVLAPGVKVGANARVSAGSVVMREVPAGVTVMGNPARAVREHAT